MERANSQSQYAASRLVFFSLCIALTALSLFSATPPDGNNPQAPVIADDPAERDAFAAMISETGQHGRREMAERFLVDYPPSWRLAPVYEIAAKSSIALGDLPAALDFGARSLRILRENPFLLPPMADVQTKSGLYEAASRSAPDAVWYLDRFDHPTSIDARTWPRLKNRLEAEGYFDSQRGARQVNNAWDFKSTRSKVAAEVRSCMTDANTNKAGMGASASRFLLRSTGESDCRTFAVGD